MSRDAAGKSIEYLGAPGQEADARIAHAGGDPVWRPGERAATRERIDLLLAAPSAGTASPDCATPPSLPDVRILDAMVRRRRLRDAFLGGGLFADPAWDILLELGAAKVAKRRVSVSSLCIAAAVPTTTALRWIKIMTDRGFLEREADPTDRRRTFIALTAEGAGALAAYFEKVAGCD